MTPRKIAEAQGRKAEEENKRDMPAGWGNHEAPHVQQGEKFEFSVCRKSLQGLSSKAEGSGTCNVEGTYHRVRYGSP